MRTSYQEIFEDLYGLPLQAAYDLINSLAPVTRRDDWWATEGPLEIIGKWHQKRTDLHDSQ
jgi:hypothetical protein